MAKLQLNNNTDIDLDHYTTELEQNISDLNVIQNNLNSLIYNQTDKLLQIEDNMSNTKEDILVSNVNLKKVSNYYIKYTPIIVCGIIGGVALGPLGLFLGLNGGIITTTGVLFGGMTGYNLQKI
jgi:hypothetical protein